MATYDLWLEQVDYTRQKTEYVHQDKVCYRASLRETFHLRVGIRRYVSKRFQISLNCSKQTDEYRRRLPYSLTKAGDT
jgi:hypothetical protein